MPAPAVPSWLFLCAADRTWAWRSANAHGDLLPSLDVAIMVATKHGFDPFAHYWTATIDGRTTHYRPSRTPVNLPSNEDPPE